MARAIKEMVSDEIKRRIGDTTDFIVIDTSKLTGTSVTTLRNKLREQQIRMLTVRNSIARRIFREKGQPAITPLLEGPSCLVWGGKDIVALSKEVTKSRSDMKELSLKGGVVDGSTLTAADVESLSKSPGREELLGMIMTRLLGPGAWLAGALLGPGGVVAGQIKSKSEGDAESGEAPAAG
jgi:large subunit ribosomal protein L10